MLLRRLAGRSSLPVRFMAMSSAAAALSSPIKSMDAIPTVRVVTYNVLSSSLCEPSWFPKCDPKNLSPPTRLERVLDLLDKEVSSQTVFCLQEVSRDWEGALHVFFAERGYQFSSSLYGRKFNGYMGVALAWPTKRFDVRRVESFCLADGLPSTEDDDKNKKQDKKPPPPFLDRVSEAYSILKGEQKKRPERIFDTWNEASRRQNTIVAVDLETTSGERFCVANYHMPCLFGSIEKEQVMVIHAKLAADYAAKFAAGSPYVLAGDFNLKPIDASYCLLTKGKLDEEFAEYAPPVLEPTLQEPLVSAYAKKLGKEPNYTNLAFTVNSIETFAECLDYIFCKPNAWQVQSVKSLPGGTPDLEKPYPDKNEPSDHVLLAADLKLVS